MQDQSQQEVRRIMDLVSQGTVSPEEGERLIASIESRRYQVRCPYCAESIPGGQSVCPECQSVLVAGHTTPRGYGGGFQGLSALPKFLVVYQILVCVMVLLGGISSGRFLFVSGASLMAVLGLVSAIQICRSHPLGWTLGCLWAGLQIVDLHLGGYAVTRQFFHIGIHFTSNGTGLGLNLVGIILLVLFMKARAAANPVPNPYGGPSYPER